MTVTDISNIVLARTRAREKRGNFILNLLHADNTT